MKNVLLIVVTILYIGNLFAQSLWSTDSRFIYDKAMREGKALECPEVIEAEEVLQETVKGKFDIDALRALAYINQKEMKALNEVAIALLLLERVQANDAQRFRSGLIAFREDYPKSRCLPYLTQLNQLLMQCPKCKGWCIKRVKCNRCKNTQLCPTCKGDGNIVNRGMKRTRRVPIYNTTTRSTTSSPSRKRKLGSHSTSYYRNGYTEVVESNETERKCPTCQGTGTCLTCKDSRVQSSCSECKNTGYVPDKNKLPNVFTKVAEIGIKAISEVDSEARKQWSDTQATTKELINIRTKFDREEVITALQKMLVDYPSCVQRESCGQLLKFFVLQKEEESKQKAEANKLSAAQEQEVALVRKELNNAINVKALADRLEVLQGIERRHPRAKNRSEIEVAISICTLELEQQEESLRNAINLISMEEDPAVGIRRCDELAATIDPNSRLMTSLQDTRKQFVERQKKDTRLKYGIYAIIGAIVLVVIYCIISIFAPRR